MKRSEVLSGVRKATLVVVGGAMVTLAACSGGGAPNTNSDQPGGKATTRQMTFAMVTHGPPGDTFWDQVQRGAQAAAAKDNIKLQYSGNEDASAQALAAQAAVDSKVDGITVTLAKPEPMEPVLAKAKAAGIPFNVVNAGLDTWKQTGAFAFFGLDIQASGVVSGQQLAQQGGKKAICVVQEQGSVVLEALCQGAARGFGSGSMENLQVNGADLSSVQATLTAKLQQDKSIDSIATLNAPIGLAAAQAEQATGSTAKITTLNVTPDIVEPIKSGQIIAAIDQQGWLQGYEAVDSLWLNKTNANILGSGQPVLTGPTLVTKDNIDVVAPLIQTGTR